MTHWFGFSRGFGTFSRTRHRPPAVFSAILPLASWTNTKRQQQTQRRGNLPSIMARAANTWQVKLHHTGQHDTGPSSWQLVSQRTADGVCIKEFRLIDFVWESHLSYYMKLCCQEQQTHKLMWSVCYLYMQEVERAPWSTTSSWAVGLAGFSFC